MALLFFFVWGTAYLLAGFFVTHSAALDVANSFIKARSHGPMSADF